MMARPNAVRHDWPRRELTAVLEDLPAPPIRTGAAGAAIRAWERWQDGLTMRSTWLAELMPLPRKLVLDGRAQDAGVRVLTVRARGDAVGHTAGGSWLNMAESIQRILKQRAPGDQHPEVTGQIIGWFEAAGHWNASPTLFAGGEADGAAAASARAEPPPTAGPDQLWPCSMQMTHALPAGVVPCPMLPIARSITRSPWWVPAGESRGRLWCHERR